ncbi:MAG: homoserine dehydrogenase, partial [Planctomycetota bacterium]
MSKVLGVGIIGAGTVGGGVVKILNKKSAILESRTGTKLDLVKVADLDSEKLNSLGLDAGKITDNADEVINSADVDVIVELIGGTGAAYDIVEKSLKAGKNVVTANKALLSERGAPLFKLAEENNCALAFEAAVAGAIPIIKAVRDGLAADEITCLLGIVNGTCNYILTQMINNGQDYTSALSDAQKLGFAEADPTFDVEGNDSAHKLTLLAQLGFDTSPDYTKLNIQGITGLSLDDVAMASEMGYTAKLLAVARPA